MDKALQTMIDNMPEKTGRSLEEWKQDLKHKNFVNHAEAVNYLKSEHGVTHGFANTIVVLSKESDDEPDDLVKSQYEGKEGLLPIYDSLLKHIKEFGDDITITPKKGSVSLIRKRQFALIKPATKTRIDLGLKLPGEKIDGRLEGSGPFGSMCSHRIQLTDADQVDSEVISWLNQAYEMSV